MKIIIIGNGFDLNLGLKTSYQSFLKSNDFQQLILQNNSLALYLKDINEINNWADLEAELSNYSQQVNIETPTVKNISLN